MLRFLLISILLSISVIASAARSKDFIQISKVKDRAFFYSTQYGYFWSIGIVTFMDAGANDPLKKHFKSNYGKALYDVEFERIQRLGFNTLGGWSNLEFLGDRMPYGIVLFDDPDHPLKWPLRDYQGKPPPLRDSELPCPIGDPYDLEYIKALDAYLVKYVEKNKDDRRLLMYWIGAEFGLGDTNAIDFSTLIFSKGVQKEFVKWLEKKYSKIDLLNKSWKTEFISFGHAAAAEPLQDRGYKDDTLNFSNLVIQDWIKLVTEKIRKKDPNHLIGSPKISLWDAEPFLDEPIRLRHFETFKNYFDVFSVDWYSGNPTHKSKGLNQIKSISRMLGVPVIIGEWGIREKRPEWTNTPGARSLVKNQTERALNYESQLRSVFSHPEFIGAHWFRWQDHLVEKHQFNKGMIRIENNKIAEYEELTRSMKIVHSELNKKVHSQTSSKP